MNKTPFTHAVWKRYYVSDGKILSGWWDDPRLYRSEESANMAAHDLNKYYTNEQWGNFVQHIVLPMGVHPSTMLIDGLPK